MEALGNYAYVGRTWIYLDLRGDDKSWHTWAKGVEFMGLPWLVELCSTSSLERCMSKAPRVERFALSSKAPQTIDNGS